MSAEKVCHECGATTGIMAQASRGEEARRFCHNEVRDCYNARRGRYFEEERPPRNPYAGIRKVRKAQWVYECRVCDTRSRPSTDLFGAVEAKRRHMLTSDHVFKAMEEAFNPIVSAMMEMGRAVTEAFKPLMDLSAPPPNLPHDPSLLKDKRKWGGR